MKFQSEHENPLPDLVELRTTVVSKSGGYHVHEVLVELRVHPFEIEEAFGRISVAIFQAVLSVQFSGLEVVPRTKLGNPVVDTKTRNEVQRERSVTNTSDEEKTRQSRLGTGASAIGVEAKADYSRGSTEKSAHTVVERITNAEVVEHLNVKAIGNDNWKISEASGAALDGVYINHVALCEVTPVAGKNRIGVETEVIVRQRHLKAEIIGDQSLLASLFSTNHKKIQNILIAKSLHDAGNDGSFDGKFVFAKSQSFDEG